MKLNIKTLSLSCENFGVKAFMKLNNENAIIQYPVKNTYCKESNSVQLLSD